MCANGPVAVFLYLCRTVYNIYHVIGFVPECMWKGAWKGNNFRLIRGQMPCQSGKYVALQQPAKR